MVGEKKFNSPSPQEDSIQGRLLIPFKDKTQDSLKMCRFYNDVCWHSADTIQ